MKKKYLLPGIITLVVLVFLEEGSGVLEEGSRAPQFTATLSSGQVISLHDFVGKKHVVLFFYPKDFTAGCTAQVCDLRDHYQELLEQDAVVFGVSRDGQESHEKFIEAHGLPFPLISDSGSSLIKAYGVERLWGLIGLPKRVTYVIDKEGVIRLVAHHEFAIKSHREDVLATLKRLNASG